MAQRVTVRERIDPAITASLFANYRSSADAVMELVDNAIDSRLKGGQLEVFLLVHTTYFVIETRGGEGMGPAELERNYLRWGGSPKRGRKLLGQYGQGGKAAIGHLGTSFTVEASRPGDGNAWRFADPDYRDRSKLKTYELKTVTKRVPADQGYVRIRIDGFDKRLDARRLSARLGDTYRPLILRAELKMTVNGSRVEPPSINFQEEHRFAVHAAGTTLRGWYGLAEPEGRGVDYVPGLRLLQARPAHHRRRVFRPPQRSPGLGHGPPRRRDRPRARAAHDEQERLRPRRSGVGRGREENACLAHADREAVG
jgi:hypothetical protein